MFSSSTQSIQILVKSAKLGSNSLPSNVDLPDYIAYHFGNASQGVNLFIKFTAFAKQRIAEWDR